MDRISPNDYLDLQSVTDPRISPDGESIAYVRRQPSGDREYESVVEIAPLNGEAPRMFTADEWSATAPQWSPSGDRIAFVSTRGPSELPQLWVAPTSGGEAHRVTNVPGGVANVTWSPDGSAIAFVQETTETERMEADFDMAADEEQADERPDPFVIDRLVYRSESAYRTARSWEEYFGTTRNHVYIIELGDETVRRVTDGDTDHFGLSWGGADDLYFLARRGDDDSVAYDVVCWNRTRDERETITRTYIHPGLTMLTVSATTDGRIAYPTDISNEKRMRQTDIAVYDRTEGTETVLTKSIDRKAAHAPLLSWGPAEEAVYFTVPDEGESVVYRVADDGRAELEHVFTGTDIDGAHVGREVVAITQSEWDHPGDVFVASLDDGTAERVTNVNSAYLDTHAVQEPEEIRFSTDNGPDVQGWILTPPDFDPERTYPLVVEVHGGPVAMWSMSGTMWHELQSLANAGYVVFWSNPRGSIGYGEAFTRAVEGDWGGPYYEDLMAGVNEMVARDYVDAENVFITGGSYGGYMTAWAIGQTDRFRAANPQRGVYDLNTMYGTSSVANLLEYMYAGVLPWDDPARYREDSPISYVQNVDTPTLIFQSETDYNTPAADSEMYYRYLKKNGVTASLVYYPRDGHELSRSGEPAHVVDRLERIIAWFDGYSDYSHVERPCKRPNVDGVDSEDA